MLVHITRLTVLNAFDVDAADGDWVLGEFKTRCHDVLVDTARCLGYLREVVVQSRVVGNDRLGRSYQSLSILFRDSRFIIVVLALRDLLGTRSILSLSIGGVWLVLDADDNLFSVVIDHSLSLNILHDC